MGPVHPSKSLVQVNSRDKPADSSRCSDKTPPADPMHLQLALVLFIRCIFFRTHSVLRPPRTGCLTPSSRLHGFPVDAAWTQHGLSDNKAKVRRGHEGFGRVREGVERRKIHANTRRLLQLKWNQGSTITASRCRACHFLY